MSRIRESEVSSPISLFPFIGILLCTMGALLVILVAVSRSAGDSAKREVARRQQSGVPNADHEQRQELDEVNKYLEKLSSVRHEAEKKLRNEQARLSHLEDHIRRLREEMKSLRAAAGELVSLQEEHYDDRKQAEQEVQRLRELIVESQKTIDSLREQAAKGKRSYALVPYEGPNGTHRRPMYVECADNQLILQPEGVKISSDELLPPFGAGNPLAAALRATRDHIIRLHPDEGQGRDTEPYALILVRPSGLMMFSRARAAIEAGDFDLGYELVEADWKLKYPAADLSLADLQQQAIQEALTRQQLLAAAAPRAYRHPALVAAGQFDDVDDSDEPVGRGEAGGYVVRGKESAAGDAFDTGATGNGSHGSGGGDFPGGSGDGTAGGSFSSGGASRGAFVGGNSQNVGPVGGGPPADESAGQIDGAGGGSRRTAGPPNGNSAVATGEAPGITSGAAGATGQAGGAVSGSDMAAGSAGQSGGSRSVAGAGSGNASGGMSSAAGAGGIPMSNDPDQQLQPGNFSVVTRSPPPDAAGGTSNGVPNGVHAAGSGSLAQSKGKDWALGKKPPRAVPIRRTIHVVVRQDQIAIVPDIASPTTSIAGGTIIPMQGDTVEAVEAFVTQVHKCVNGWGLAGDGLYWRPVLVLNVAPDGQRRADDLARLLKNSGLELRSNDTAQSNKQGQSK
jgi:hypothetical protein